MTKFQSNNKKLLSNIMTKVKSIINCKDQFGLRKWAIEERMFEKLRDESEKEKHF